jgi:hypothetical protein
MQSRSKGRKRRGRWSSPARKKSGEGVLELDDGDPPVVGDGDVDEEDVQTATVT